LARSVVRPLDAVRLADETGDSTRNAVKLFRNNAGKRLGARSGRNFPDAEKRDKEANATLVG
jgi:hypothetical protein